LFLFVFSLFRSCASGFPDTLFISACLNNPMQDVKIRKKRCQMPELFPAEERMYCMNSRRMVQGKRCLAVMALLLLFCMSAGSEPAEWICPSCGQEGNTGNFCPNCAAARPVPVVNDGTTQIPGETERVSVDILRIDGSGFVRSGKNKYLYAPEKSIDGNEATCWMFSVKQNRKDQPWLAMIVEGQAIDEIWIRNGMQASDKKGKSQYLLYARLKEIRVVFYTDGSEPDEMFFTLSDENSGTWEKLDTGRHDGVGHVVVYIQSVYKGRSRPSTACLSEIMLVQAAPSETAKPVIE